MPSQLRALQSDGHRVPPERTDAYTRRVFANAFLDFKKTQNVDKTGSSEVSSFLLVIPGSTVPVEVGDKVLLGEGPKVSTRADWSALIPG